MAEPQKYQFANELGFIRKEGVFSTIDVRKVDLSAGLFDAFNVQYVKLRLAESINRTNQREVTTTLVEVNSESQFTFPKGSCILEVALCDRSNGHIDEELSFMFGYLSDEVTDNTRLATLAQRIADEGHQITGKLLNSREVVHLDQRLTSVPLAAQIALYDAEDEANGLDPENVDVGIISGQNYVGERKSLMPAITVTSGNLLTHQVDFIFKYIPNISS